MEVNSEGTIINRRCWKVEAFVELEEDLKKIGLVIESVILESPLVKRKFTFGKLKKYCSFEIAYKNK